MKVYTMRKLSPFTLGGNLNKWFPVACEVEAQGPFDTGRGFVGYLVIAPNGKTFVAEGQFGAFVGSTIEEVRKDIETGDPAIMDKQVEDACKVAETAEIIPAAEFWELLGCEAREGEEE